MKDFGAKSSYISWKDAFIAAHVEQRHSGRELQDYEKRALPRTARAGAFIALSI